MVSPYEGTNRLDFVTIRSKNLERLVRVFKPVVRVEDPFQDRAVGVPTPLRPNNSGRAPEAYGCGTEDALVLDLSQTPLKHIFTDYLL